MSKTYSSSSFSLFLLILSLISTSKAADTISYHRPTLGGRVIAGIIVGAICFTALVCLILVLGERRRRSRSRPQAQASGLNLTRTQTLDPYPITHPSPGPGLGFTQNQNQNEKSSKEKSSRFGLSKLGMGKGKRQGGVCDPARNEQQAHSRNPFLYPPPQLQNPAYDLRDDDGTSRLLDAASIPIPEGPPPVYTDGICEKGRHIEPQEPFKYDPPLGPSPGHSNPTDAETSSNTQVVYPPPLGRPPPVHTYAATMPKGDSYFPGGFVA